MDDQLDLRAAYEELAHNHAELVLAFHELGTLLAGALTRRETLEPEEVADELQDLALIAGERLAAGSDKTPSPNPHLLALSITLRARGGVPLAVIDGGKLDEEDEGPDAA